LRDSESEVKNAHRVTSVKLEEGSNNRMIERAPYAFSLRAFYFHPTETIILPFG